MKKFTPKLRTSVVTNSVEGKIRYDVSFSMKRNKGEEYQPVFLTCGKEHVCATSYSDLNTMKDELFECFKNAHLEFGKLKIKIK